MTAEGRNFSTRVLTVFQQTWAERDAFCLKQTIEASGHPANWEEILQACQTRAQQLFQPALSDLAEGRSVVQVFKELSERLDAPP